MSTQWLPLPSSLNGVDLCDPARLGALWHSARKLGSRPVHFALRAIMSRRRR